MQTWLLVVAGGLLAGHLAASLVVALTRTPCRDEAVGVGARVWAWVYPWIERAALVVGHAKELPGGGWRMAQDVEAALHQRTARDLLAARDRVMGHIEGALDDAARYAYNRAAAEVEQIFRAHERGANGDG